MRMLLAAVVAVETEQVSHTTEWLVVISTIALTIVTAALTAVTMKALKSESKVANNSIDSMEHVSVAALTHSERVRRLQRIAQRKRNNVSE